MLAMRNAAKNRWQQWKSAWLSLCIEAKIKNKGFIETQGGTGIGIYSTAHSTGLTTI
jgi:hypothetical protein